MAIEDFGGGFGHAGLVQRARAMDKSGMNAASVLLRVARDFALPARCPGCGVVVEGDDRFCLECWSALEFLSRDGCDLCNMPMGGVEGMTCGRCLAQAPSHDGVRAAVGYCDIARGVALKLKYSGRPAMARLIAAQLVRHFDPAPGDLLIPVPLHRWRIWSRGYNQSVLIARALAGRAGGDLAIDALIRTKRTPLLRGLGAVERAKMMRGAFAVRKDARASLAGRHIWLVDDVYTSGATANACAKALKRAGATRVTILCWARVLRADD
ncbi:ComF family protein [Sphingobium boeckii]|uniref:ComF family protein n=1 Tax=Sphingobium boeckii TaxID=1082345 RepID=A0A7W9EGC7_9SPHN|nr:ComF family protein [Sphingobium boeckii]